MVAGWLPWSAASLVSGAVLLVLGALLLPLGGDLPFVAASAADDPGRWLMAAVALGLASAGLTLGLPTVLSVACRPGRRPALFGGWLWALGTIGMSALAALLIGFNAVSATLDLTASDVARLAEQPGIRLLVLAVVVAFHVGELVVAASLLRSRTVAAWVPWVMVAHVLTVPLVALVAIPGRGLHTALLGAAMMGVASRASSDWAAQRA